MSDDFDAVKNTSKKICNESDEFKKAFLDNLKDDEQRKKFIAAMSTISLRRDVNKFEEVVGLSISKFLLFLEDGSIRLDKSNSKTRFKCPHCDTVHHLFIDQKSVMPERVEGPVTKKYMPMYTNINCVLCGFTVSIPGNLKKVEVSF